MWGNILHESTSKLTMPGNCRWLASSGASLRKACHIAAWRHGIYHGIYGGRFCIATMFCRVFPQTVCLTLGVLTVSEKAGWLDRGGGRISSLFSWFRACMFVLSVNLRSFGGGALVGPRCCVWIFVVSGSSTSSMFIFRGNYRTFRCSAMLLKGSETGFAW